MKRRTQRLGLRDVKSMQSISARSIPRVQRSSYLDLYLMTEKRRRLEKEISILEVRRNIARKQLTIINKNIDKLQGEGIEKQRGRSRPPASKPMKRMAIHYG
ncbi:hypothetical protein HZC34_04040 [Candidatus Saganbacteria bacterium]|nr:hypothetical protein [Candidatus Saganbacteria bacterium]